MTDLICLAKIVAAHGIQGEVKIKTFTLAPKDVLSYGALSNIEGTRFFELTFKGLQKGLLRVKIKGVETRNDAEGLVGTELFISRDKLPDLEENTFYQADLIGMDVLDIKTNSKIGKVVGIFNFGAGDILEIKIDGVKQTEMLPFNDDYVPSVDVKNKTVSVAFRAMNYQPEDESDA